MVKVCHLSSAHAGLDTRIFYKECLSLARAGYDVHLVIYAEKADVESINKENISFHFLTKPKNRWNRMLRQTWRCYRIAKRIEPDIIHFHDPELIPIGIYFALAGKQVIYDVHEDYPQSILSKAWIPTCLRQLTAKIIGAIEHSVAKRFFHIIAATPVIAKRFKKYNPNTIDINNYPLLEEFPENLQSANKQNQICYIGGITKIRGIQEICQAMALVKADIKLSLCGKFSEPAVEKQVKSLPGWRKVDEIGFVNRHLVFDVLSRSLLGLVVLHPVINYLDALPVKMFEYMAAGIPVIASNFPYWKVIIEQSNCGVVVDPLNPLEIAKAIDYLVTHPDEANRMGNNGREAVLKHFNWQQEEKKLLAFYVQICEK